MIFEFSFSLFYSKSRRSTKASIIRPTNVAAGTTTTTNALNKKKMTISSKIRVSKDFIFIPFYYKRGIFYYSP
jgi:hypothetical protein